MTIKVKCKPSTHKVLVRKVDSVPADSVPMDFLIPGWDEFVTGSNRNWVEPPDGFRRSNG